MVSHQPFQTASIESKQSNVEVSKVIIKESENLDTSVAKETPSIFRKKKADKVDDNPKPVLEKYAEAFTENQLQEAWKLFGVHKKATGTGEMEQLILGRSIEVSENNNVLITLNSSLELEIVDRLEMELITYLRKTLKNDNIQLEKQVTESETVKKLYTSQDKYEFMLKQNPALKKLKDRLGLDFEY